MRRNISLAIKFSLATVALAASAQADEPTPAYRVVKTVALGAPDRWDLLEFDPATHRVYVAHGDRVTVVDGHSGAIVGAVEGIAGGTHDIAVPPGFGHGYTDDGKAGAAIAFDRKTLKIVKSIVAADDADAMAYDPVSRHVFVIDSDPGQLTVIDPKADAVVATIDGGGKLELAVSGDNGKLYVNGEAKGEIVRVDTASNQVDAHWPMPGCTDPHGLAIDHKTHRLFASCANSVLAVVDADTGALVTTLPIGQGTDGAAFDPKRRLIFSSNGKDGTLSIIEERDANTFVSRGEIKTALTGRTMTIDQLSGRLYILAADIDPAAPVVPGKRPSLIPGSLKLLFLDPH